MTPSPQRQTSLIASIVVLAVLVVVLGGGVYFFVASIIDKLASTGSDLAGAIVAAAATVFAATITLILGKAWEQRVNIQQEVRAKKVPVYEQQIRTFFEVMYASKAGRATVSKVKLEKAFLDFTEKLLIWGSPDVIIAWSNFRLHDWPNSSPAEGFMKLDAFIHAIRRDVGNSNSGLAPGQLMQLFINDLPALDK